MTETPQILEIKSAFKKRYPDASKHLEKLLTNPRYYSVEMLDALILYGGYKVGYLDGKEAQK